MKVFRWILIAILGLATTVFALTTFYRLSLEYNEMGRHFDGGVVYNSDAIIGYGLLTVICLGLTGFSFIITQRYR
jgi:hypothetical protein